MRSLCLSNFRGRDMSRVAQARQPSSFLKFQPAQSASPSKWWIKLCQHIRMGAESSRTQARVKFRPELSRIKVRAPRRVSNILTNGRFTRLIKMERWWHQQPKLRNFRHNRRMLIDLRSKSVPFTRERSKVRSLQRPPFTAIAGADATLSNDEIGGAGRRRFSAAPWCRRR